LRQILKSLILSVITIALLIILSLSYGQIPPLGKFFDPIIGFWSVAWQDDFPAQSKLSLPGLKNEVTIIFDKRGVPHIFGTNETDVYTAIGYVHARDRLWQMDIQYRFSAGRLSEILGKQGLATDINQRRLGLAVTAERTLANLDTNQFDYQIIAGYVRGVNHYINQLSYRDYPYEFKLLNYKPEPWTIEKTILLNVSMGYLSRTMDDLYFSRLQQMFSQQELEELYPLFFSIPYPIIPEQNEKGAANQIYTSDGRNQKLDLNFNHETSIEKRHIDKYQTEGLGSNNWVVSGLKTKTGKPILANDPHLGLDIPSVWYEAHLNCPEFDVYGVTLTGAPFVIIGFNRHIAWGMTTCGWDVTDLYREVFDNKSHDHYRYNGTWQPVMKLPQTIRLKDAPDTTIVLEYTHRGPIISRYSEFFSMQWTGNQTDFGGISVYWLNKAKSFKDYRQALKFYNCPAQNFIYADVKGNIAITSTGKNPVRKKGLGRSIANGNSEDSDWISYTPFEQLPASLNPKQGYLASANQQPLNQLTPYFGWNWPTDYRARRINELLKNHDQLNVKDMMKFQTDAYSVQAEVFVPYLLKAFEKHPFLTDSTHLDSVISYLRNWNYEMRKNEVGATLFDRFMENFQKYTWHDHYPTTQNERFILPSKLVLEKIMQSDPDSRWFDDMTTAKKENRDDMIRKSLIDTYHQLSDEFGKDISEWKWGRYHKTRIPHLSRLRPLGIDPFPNNGGNGTLNVGAGRVNSFGPSCRMIVSLENPIRAWSVYPGGQSGNPASKHYMDFLETWKSEQYFEILFPENPSGLAKDLIESQISIIPEVK